MNKIKLLAKKHRIVTVILCLLAVVVGVKLIGWEVKRIFACGTEGMKMLVQDINTQEYWESFVESCYITQSRAINVLLFYFVLRVVMWGILLGVAIIISLLEAGVGACMKNIQKLVLGELNQNSLEYTGLTLGVIKCSADIDFFMYLVKEHIPYMGYKDNDDNALVKWVRIFSFEGFVSVITTIAKILFYPTILHLFLGGVAIYTSYEADILLLCECIINLVMQKKFSIEQCLQIVDLLTNICLIGFVVFGIRYKVKGSFELRVERFKELVQMEEKLLNVLKRATYALQQNIEVIVDRKSSIMNCGASELLGKWCYFNKAELRSDGPHISYNRHDGLEQFRNLCEMEQEFQELSELSEEYKNSSLRYVNINFIDPGTMFNKVPHFWIPTIDDIEFKKMEFLCKSFMEEWYTNRFIAPTEIIERKKSFYSEIQIKERVFAASAIMDYELMRAFWLELYMKRYIKKLDKRLKKIYNYSKLDLK